ncbi:hypothetical protein MTO96_015796 [Rhipicephalus appendiculatus]
MASRLAEFFKMPGQMVAVLPKLRRKMAPAGLLLRAPPRPPVLRTPPLQLRRRLARVPVTAAARRGIGSTPPPALPGTGRVRGADGVDTSRESAAPLRKSSTGHQGTSMMTNTVTVLQVDETVTTIGLHLPVRINGFIFNMLIDTGAAVSLLNVQDYKRNFSHIKLLPSHLVLQNYSEQAINNHGYFKATVSYNGNCATIPFYFTDKGTSLLGLDAIRALKIIIRGETLTCSLVDSSTVPANAPPEYQHVFSSDIGTVRNYVHRVKRRPGVQPVAAKLRRLPFF